MRKKDRKKAVRAGTRAAKIEERKVSYLRPTFLSRKIFERNRRSAIAGLWAASNSEDRRAIRRGCRAGRKLRKEAEALLHG